MKSTAQGHVALIELLRSEIDTVLSPVLGRPRRVALLGFPNYPNVGDSAIWLGEAAWLRKNGFHVTFAGDEFSYSRDTLERALGRDGAILLQGGGNFGDLYPQHQAFRERIVGDFPGRAIIQLPQTIEFASPGGESRAREVLGAHPNLTILARDARSYQYATRAYPNAQAALCPDMAFCLGPQAGPAPRVPVLFLRRSDDEAALRDARLAEGVTVADWVSLEDGIASRRYARRLRIAEKIGYRMARSPRLDLPFRSCLGYAYNALARSRVSYGLRLLTGARVVVTDRLHAHILCLLSGIPHVLMDNSYGKLRAFHEAWTASSDLCVWCDDPVEAQMLAMRTAQEGATRFLR